MERNALVQNVYVNMKDPLNNILKVSARILGEFQYLYLRKYYNIDVVESPRSNKHITYSN